MQTLSLAYSPCPNDTFIFDAMVHGKIDTEGLSFRVHLADVETLNQSALNEESDVTKLSFHAYAYAAEKYVLLHSGSALGRGCGPILIRVRSRPDGANSACQMEFGVRSKVAIPGRYTTANFLLGLYAPEVTGKVEMVFSEIEDTVLTGKVDAGVIIHENRFTYEQKGLEKIVDLGEYWEQLTGAPIPLGGIAAKRSLPEEVLQKVNRVIRRSIEFAMAHPQSGMDYIRCHAQEMSEEVMRSHIALYVNKYSVDLEETGREAVLRFFKEGVQRKIILLNEEKNRIFL